MAEDSKRPEPIQTSRLSRADFAQIKAGKLAASKQRPISLLLYHHGGVQVVPLVEGRKLVIGRFPPSDVVLRDDSLSRQHGSVELRGQEVWIEDLDSTNGTWVNGEPIKACQVPAGAEIYFGAVSGAIHILDPGDARGYDLDSHDRFMADLASEILRAGSFKRGLALLLVRGAQDSPISHWFPAIRSRIRPFDKLAFYSADTVEILLPELSEREGRELAGKLLESQDHLLVGLGLYPTHAVSANELMDVTREALRAATPETPIQVPAGASASLPAGLAAKAAGPVVMSPAMREVYRTVARLATSQIPVLILGETGSGKEVIARAIHEGGRRSGAPLLCMNCGSIPQQLVESTLFGHEKGAFTGADQQARGIFESAQGGTVLLDEIGELPAAAQAALLRVLETKRLTRVGGARELTVDVRVLAATHRDLQAMCQEGEFREDLLYRLNAMTLKVPPLRERVEEIEPLALLFLRQANQANDRQVKGFDPDAIDHLRRYPWPGNVRELRNVVERAVVIAEADTISAGDLPEAVQGQPSAAFTTEPEAGADGGEDEAGGDGDLRAVVRKQEAEIILKALNRAGGNSLEAARALKLPLRTLFRKMKLHGIKKDTYRQRS